MKAQASNKATLQVTMMISINLRLMVRPESKVIISSPHPF
jgi:hypothetical protein